MTASSDVATSATLSHRQVLRVLSGILLGMFLAALDQTIIVTPLPSIAAEDRKSVVLGKSVYIAGGRII